MNCILKPIQSYPFPVEKETNPMLLTNTCFTDQHTAKALEIEHHGYRYIITNQEEEILVLIVVNPSLEVREMSAILFVSFNIIKKFHEVNPEVRVLRKKTVMNSSLLPSFKQAKQINVYFNSSFVVDAAIISMLTAGSYVIKTGEYYLDSLWLGSFLRKFRSLDAQLYWSLLIKEHCKGQISSYFRCYMQVVDQYGTKEHFLFKNGATKLNIKQMDLHPYNLYQTIKIDKTSKLIYQLQAYAGLIQKIKEKVDERGIILLKTEKDIGLASFLHSVSQNALDLNFECLDCNMINSYQQFDRKLEWLSNLEDSVIYIKNVGWIQQLYQADQILNVQMKHIMKKIEDAHISLRKNTPRRYLFVIEAQGNKITEDMFLSCHKIQLQMDKSAKRYIFQMIFNQIDFTYRHKQQVVQVCHDKFGWEKFKSFLEGQWHRVKGKEVGDVLKEISKLIKQEEVQNLIEVSWDDVGGLEAAKEEIIQTILLPIRHPQIFDQWIKPRTGLLFYGPPGTGKTLLGKCIAKECKMSFISVKGPQLLNMYVGESQKNVRQVFERAAACRPCIVFMDQLDALIPKRGNNSDSHQVMDRIVAELLVQMDSASANQVFIIGATNRPDLLDPSIMRPGRFDKQIYLGITKNKEDRVKILKAQTRQLSLEQGIDWLSLLERIPQNFTGADFYGLTSKAVMVAAERTIEQFQRGIEHQKIIIAERDFLVAAQKVKPSVNESQLRRYEQLKKIYS